MKKILILLSAVTLSLTLATAADMKCEAGKCGGNDKKEMKCQAGKCGGADKKDMKKKCGDGKCDSSKKSTKEAPKKGKCGEGKCG